MPNVKLEIGQSDVGPILAGLVVATVRLAYDQLYYASGAPSSREIPKSAQLELAQMATDAVLKCFPPGVREKLRTQREELAAMMIGAEVIND
jgi:hypothetical protein